MRYRTLSPNDDYVFGQGQAEFMVDSPETVAQAVRTRLRLSTGEWFLDTTEGTPYATEILGAGTQSLYDSAIKERVVGTPGVVSIDDYSSYLGQDRALTVTMTISTQYGQTTLSQAF